MNEVLFQKITSRIDLSTQKEEALRRLGLITIKDLLLYRPNYYKKRLLMPDLSLLKAGDEVIIKIKIQEIDWPKKRNAPVRMYASNESGSITVVFFTFYPSIERYFQQGAERIVSGRIEFFDHKMQLSHPEIIWNSANIRTVEPVYSLTYGIINSQLSSYISQAIDLIPDIPEWLPEKILTNYELPSFSNAISGLHVSKKKQCTIAASYRRLKVDELFANQICLKTLRQQRQQQRGHSFSVAKDLQLKVMSNLKFTLTEGQTQALNEIALDQKAPEQMLRMLQGDVGCGKTIVALLSALNVVIAGGQVAIMAPTDILAQQHFQFIDKALNNLQLNIVLLTGKIKNAKKHEVLQQIQSGFADVVIGTHALFQEKVIFSDLRYIIVDEQHRFGVNQRLELINKGNKPDILIMSATPIPRSLAITLFGDMAVSKITSMPQGRQPIKTYNAPIAKLQAIALELRKRLNSNEQIYWICPLIEHQEATEDREKIFYSVGNVENRYSHLSSLYPNQVGLLHGKVTGAIKEEVMTEFKEGKIKILVSTTVVEVGVDVPTATIIVIENAERFGLAQLHQLRGRVGRANLASMCILLYDKNISKTSFERLKIMQKSSDGFYIAEEDLKLRGGGEILGQKQSGEQSFKFADLYKDFVYIVAINQAAIDQEHTEEVKTLLRIFSRDINQTEILS